MRGLPYVSAALFHSGVKRVWVALGAGSLAGLAVLGACSDAPVSRVAAPKTLPISGPRFAILGANHHVIRVCVDPLSPAGPYSFAITLNTSPPVDSWPETKTDTDPNYLAMTPPINIDQPNGYGPWRTGVDNDQITNPVLITLPGVNCKDALVRYNSCVTADCDTNPLAHVGNRLLGFHTPDFVVNPHVAVNIDATIPAGYSFSVKCITDDSNLPHTGWNTGNPADDCNNTTAIVTDPVFVSMNIFHGAQVTYFFTEPQDLPCPAGSFNAFIADGTNEAGFPAGGVGDLLIKYDQFPAPNDNSYGANSIGWKPNRPHRFKDLVNSDHAGVRLRNPGGQVQLSFVVDYLSKSASAPSGYASLGVTGGDGDMLVGTATGISATTSLANNLNNINIPGLFNAATHAQLIGSVNVLEDSPPTDPADQTYSPITDAALTGWDFHNTYYIRISAAKLATLGFNFATWTVEPNAAALHNSPPKACPSVD